MLAGLSNKIIMQGKDVQHGGSLKGVTQWEDDNRGGQERQNEGRGRRGGEEGREGAEGSAKRSTMLAQRNGKARPSTGTGDVL